MKLYACKCGYTMSEKKGIRCDFCKTRTENLKHDFESNIGLVFDGKYGFYGVGVDTASVQEKAVPFIATVNKAGEPARRLTTEELMEKYGLTEEEVGEICMLANKDIEKGALIAKDNPYYKMGLEFGTRLINRAIDESNSDGSMTVLKEDFNKSMSEVIDKSHMTRTPQSSHREVQCSSEPMTHMHNAVGEKIIAESVEDIHPRFLRIGDTDGNDFARRNQFGENLKETLNGKYLACPVDENDAERVARIEREIKLKNAADRDGDIGEISVVDGKVITGYGPTLTDRPSNLLIREVRELETNSSTITFKFPETVDLNKVKSMRFKIEGRCGEEVYKACYVKKLVHDNLNIGYFVEEAVDILSHYAVRCNAKIVDDRNIEICLYETEQSIILNNVGFDTTKKSAALKRVRKIYRDMNKDATLVGTLELKLV